MRIVPSSEVDDEAIVELLNASFDSRVRDLSWYRWKHRNGAWGPSVGWVAVDDGGSVVGARLFVPWRICHAGRQLTILRAMDGAVHPDARRQGLFSRLVRAQMDRRPDESTPPVLLSTSVPASRDAYRKLGWSIFEVAHRFSLVAPRAARVDECSIEELGVPPMDPQLAQTAWTAESLRWRFDERSGHHYRCFVLCDADAPNGIVLRVAHRRGWRIVAVCLTWGSDRDRRALLAAVCRTLRSPVVNSVASRSMSRVSGIDRGASTVSIWTSADDVRPLRSSSCWELSFADLEGVM